MSNALRDAAAASALVVGVSLALLLSPSHNSFEAAFVAIVAGLTFIGMRYYRTRRRGGPTDE